MQNFGYWMPDTRLVGLLLRKCWIVDPFGRTCEWPITIHGWRILWDLVMDDLCIGCHTTWWKVDSCAGPHQYCIAEEALKNNSGKHSDCWSCWINRRCFKEQEKICLLHHLNNTFWGKHLHWTCKTQREKKHKNGKLKWEPGTIHKWSANRKPNNHLQDLTSALYKHDPKHLACRDGLDK